MGVVYIHDLCITLNFDLYVDVKGSTHKFDIVFWFTLGLLEESVTIHALNYHNIVNSFQ